MRDQSRSPQADKPLDERDVATSEKVGRALRIRWAAAFVALIVVAVLAGWMSRNILEVSHIEDVVTEACDARRARTEEAARLAVEMGTTRDAAVRADLRAKLEVELDQLQSNRLPPIAGEGLLTVAEAHADRFLEKCRELLALSDGAIAPPEDIAALNASVKQSSAALDSVIRETRGYAHQRIDGGLTGLNGLIAAAGVVFLFAGAFIYIPTTRLMARTERKLRETNDALRNHLGELYRTTNDLRRSHARTQAILDAAADGIIIIDPRGTVESMNAAAERLFGWTAAEVIGRSLKMLLPESHVAAHEQAVANYLRTGEKNAIGVDREIVGLRKDGSTFPMYISVGDVQVGEDRRFIGILRDISDRKASEESLSKQAQELARSNNELEQFAYVASHDLQEPLRAIASFSSLLARRYKGRLDDQADEFIGYVESGARRMHELIRDLLEYSRVSRRREPFTRVSSEKVLDAALENLQAAIAETKPEIERGTLPDVNGDLQQLTQLFQNLVGNALKFRGSGTPRVRIGAQRDGRNWRFSIRDNGIGIDPRFGERIFVIFQRLHTRDRYSGNGIGLAICKKIVERHGGTIWVESKPGEGADFQFTIPAQGAAS